MKIPRGYQNAANESLWNYLHHCPGKNPLVSMATGTGKSLNIAMFIRHWLHYYPHTRMLQLTHVKELVRGNYEELMSFWPAAPAGVYSAGLGQRDHRSQITFGGIMSVAKKAALFKHIDFLIVDEAHTISDKDTATYGRFIQELKNVNPHLVVIGFTATPFRMTSGMLTDGKLFDEVVYDFGGGETFVWAVEQGYLIRPVPKNPGFQLESDEIKITSGDFDNRATSDALRDQNILERAVDTCIALGQEQGRKRWLTFNQSIDDAELVADMFTYKGFPHEAVHSKREDRDEVMERYARGDLVGVTNRDVMTTGVNIPAIDLICVLRLTRSPGLWVQLLGRGTRPVWLPGYDLSTKEGRWESIHASGKETCLVLDFVGNTSRLGPINYPHVPARRGTKGASKEMVRECPECHSYNHISRATCEDCGYEFPPPERLRPDASESALVESRTVDLMTQPDPKQFEVFGIHRMICAKHSGRNGKPDTMRVDYFCGVRRFSTWVCLGHPEKSFPRRKAEDWWKDHGGQGPAPTDVEEGVEAAGGMNMPKFLKVWVNTKYPEIVAYDFRGTKFELPPEVGGPPLQEPEPDPTEPPASAYSYAGQGYFEDDNPF